MVEASVGPGEEQEPHPRISIAQIPFVPWALLWALAPAVTIVLIFRDLFDPVPSLMFGRDFTNLWVAGRLVLSGQASCAFDVECFRHAIGQSLGLLSKQNYSYPPHALFIAAPFALFPYFPALALWIVAGIAFFTFCARPALPKGFPFYLAAFTTAGWLNIWNGHYGFLLGGLWLLFFNNFDRFPARAGAAAGLLTFKPHLGLMIAATAVQRRPVFVAAILTTLAAVALSALAFGPDTWRDFFQATTGEQAQILTSPAAEGYFRMMPSPYVAFGRGPFGAAMQAIFVAATLWLLWRYRRWDAFSAATATFLLLPYAFNYDMTVVCLGLAVLLYCRWQSLTWYERPGLFLAFLSPQLTFYVPQIVPPVLLFALAIQLRWPVGLNSAEPPTAQGTAVSDCISS